MDATAQSVRFKPIQESRVLLELAEVETLFFALLAMTSGLPDGRLDVAIITQDGQDEGLS